MRQGRKDVDRGGAEGGAGAGEQRAHITFSDEMMARQKSLMKWMLLPLGEIEAWVLLDVKTEMCLE